jgi:hypothetical protein
LVIGKWLLEIGYWRIVIGKWLVDMVIRNINYLIVIMLKETNKSSDLA